MDEEIEMVRRICGCGNAYWVVPGEDDGQCNECYYADEPWYYLNVLKAQSDAVS
jgi:hypothetical protein